MSGRMTEYGIFYLFLVINTIGDSDGLKNVNITHGNNKI